MPDHVILVDKQGERSTSLSTSMTKLEMIIIMIYQGCVELLLMLHIVLTLPV